MSRKSRRAAGDFTALVVVPEGEGDEPRMKLSQRVIDYVLEQPATPNPYVCGRCHAVTLTVHRHPGVTPMFLSCGAGEGCGGDATSSMYPAPPLSAQFAGLPTWEWYRPSAPEFRALSGPEREHVEQGGLLIRRTSRELAPQQREATDGEKRVRLRDLFGGSS